MVLLVPLPGAVEPVVAELGAVVLGGVVVGAVGGAVGVDPADGSGTGVAVEDGVGAGRLLTVFGFGGSMVNCPPWRRSFP